MRRPLAPRMSVITEASLTFASSSTAWRRCVCRTISRLSCLRVRVRSRRSWIGCGGTKLARIRPCASRSAIQVASFTSLLRPGTPLMCAAFASTSSKRPSRMCQTGFQYTPVASIATMRAPGCLEPLGKLQQSARRRREPAHLALDPTLGDKPQAGHHFLLVHVETGTALMQCLHAHLPQGGRREALASGTLPNVLQDAHQPRPGPSVATITGARRASDQTQ